MSRRRCRGLLQPNVEDGTLRVLVSYFLNQDSGYPWYSFSQISEYLKALDGFGYSRCSAEGHPGTKLPVDNRSLLRTA